MTDISFNGENMTLEDEAIQKNKSIELAQEMLETLCEKMESEDIDK